MSADQEDAEPGSEDYLEQQRRLRKLAEAFENDKIRFAPHLADGVRESLAKMRYLPNGDVDLSTVDARVRSLAFATTAISDRLEIKDRNPLREIQRLYFEHVERNFGPYHEVAVRRGLTPHHAGRAVSEGSQGARDEITKVAPKFLESIKQLWSYVNVPCCYHLEDLNCLKGIFGGDILPSNETNIASSCGLYLDTILLPDPFLRMGPLLMRWNDRDRAYYFVKHAMNLLNYKELALAEVSPPIVAVVPDGLFYDEYQSKLVMRLGAQDGLVHASALFGRDFADSSELAEFASTLVTAQDVVEKIAVPERLLFDTEWTGTLVEQIERFQTGQMARVGINLPVGESIALQCSSRMTQANDVLLRSQQFRGVPLIDAPTSWRYFAWKLEYDNRAANGFDSASTQIISGLQSAAGGEMRWLGKVPPEALIELRKSGAIHEIRDILRKGVADLSEMTEVAFSEGASRVVGNLRSAFEMHEQAIENIRQKGWSFAKKDVGSWLAIGTVEVAAVATGLPLFGLGAFLANQFFDMPKLKELIPTAKALKKEMDEQKRSPVGLIFSHKA
jgi:hypothetical protein